MHLVGRVQPLNSFYEVFGCFMCVFLSIVGGVLYKLGGAGPFLFLECSVAAALQGCAAQPSSGIEVYTGQGWLSAAMAEGAQRAAERPARAPWLRREGMAWSRAFVSVGTGAWVEAWQRLGTSFKFSCR